MSLAAFLSSATKFQDPAFWDSFKDTLLSPSCFSEELSNKDKQKIIEIIRHSITSNYWFMCSSIVVDWLKNMSKNPDFIDNNFRKEDQMVFATIASFAAQILSKQEPNEINALKDDLISCLDEMCNKSLVVKHEAMPKFIKSLINLFKFPNGDQNLISKTLQIIYQHLKQNDNLISIIQTEGQILFDAAKEMESAKAQLQLFNILWIACARIKETSFAHKDDSLFIPSVHKISMKFNNGVKAYIITLQCQSIIFSDGTSLNQSWIDIGSNDLMICGEERILNIPFDFIDGLDAQNNVLTLLINNSFQEIGSIQEKKITINLLKKPSGKLTSQIFSRISRGESQPALSDAENESSIQLLSGTQISESQIDGLSEKKEENEERNESLRETNINNATENASQKKGIKSSIAMFYCPDTQKRTQSDVDDCLFIDSEIDPKKVDSAKNDIESHEKISNEVIDEIESIESIPPPSDELDVKQPVVYFATTGKTSMNNINSNEIKEELNTKSENNSFKKTSLPKKKSKKNNSNAQKNPKKNQELKVEKNIKEESPKIEDNKIAQHSELVSIKICQGIDALTRQRMDSVDRFGEQINHLVDVFKEDIKTTVKDRERLSIKQIDASKQKFQTNIQQFKKKESSIHQTLTDYEDDIKKMGNRLSEIQRKLRNEIQQHRMSLEGELQSLRKIIRRNDRKVEFDSDF